MITPECIETAFNHLEWLRAAIHDKEVSAAPRVRPAVASLGVAQEHHHFIVLLIDHELNACAYALLRVAFQSYVRGMWFVLCATDEQIAKFWAGREPPKMDVLLQQLELTAGFAEGILSQIKRDH